MVGRILQDERYTGTLICYKSERNKINKTFRFTEPEEQFRHQNFSPPTVSREIWEQAQVLLAERKERNVRAGADRSILRSGGLLRCEDCGRSFVGKRIHLKSGGRASRFPLPLAAGKIATPTKCGLRKKPEVVTTSGPISA